MLVAAALAEVVLLAACTLTDDGFEPARVVAPNGASDVAVVQPPPSAVDSRDAGQPDSNLRCGTASELPGCMTAFAQPEVDCVGAACDAAAPSCSDGTRNDGEGDIDCGGPCAARCATGSTCSVDDDCLSHRCDAGRCSVPTCDDGVQGPGESDVDCGGMCTARCGAGQGCTHSDECVAGLFCSGQTGRCARASCEDDAQNGTETDADCGGDDCPGCPDGSRCSSGSDCQSGSCVADFCRIHPCDDRTLNGSETDVDCGGSDPRCARCSAGGRCSADGDCEGVPCLNGFCFGCANGRLDANESDIDCGGTCGPCTAGRPCQIDSDCQRGACQDGRCCGGARVDCTRCARRLAQATLSCEHSQDPIAVENCNRFLDCLAQHPNECAVRNAESCSSAPGVCSHTLFGGNGGPGLTLADGIIGTAACDF